MRVGIIVKLFEDRKFGFIRTDHFREDVFFHQSALKDLTFKRLWVDQEVEFEINEILRMDDQILEATLVQPASRPLSKSLNEQPMRELLAAHHPRARQRKPTWREKTPATKNAAEKPLPDNPATAAPPAADQEQNRSAD